MSTVLNKQQEHVAVVVVPRDALVTSNVAQFKADIEATLAEESKIVLDLHEVQFIDSAGCGALLQILERLRDLNGTMVLCEITRTVRSLFELIRMRRVVEIFSSREEAVTAIC